MGWGWSSKKCICLPCQSHESCKYSEVEIKSPPHLYELLFTCKISLPSWQDLHLPISFIKLSKFMILDPTLISFSFSASCELFRNVCWLLLFYWEFNLIRNRSKYSEVSTWTFCRTNYDLMITIVVFFLMCSCQLHHPPFALQKIFFLLSKIRAT